MKKFRLPDVIASIYHLFVYLIKRVYLSFILGDEEIIYNVNGYKLLLPTPRKGLISRSIYLKGIWEAEVTRFIQSVLQPEMLVVDVGAHRGYYSLLFAQIAKKVICFEANKDALSGLRSNVALNGFKNVTIVEKGVFHRSGRFAFDKDHISLSTISDASDVVDCVSLDDFLATGEPDLRIDLIKIDVEGAELDVIRGARETISTHHPKMIIEVHPEKLQSYGHRSDDLYGELMDSGYAYIPIDQKTIERHYDRNVTIFCSPS